MPVLALLALAAACSSGTEEAAPGAGATATPSTGAAPTVTRPVTKVNAGPKLELEGISNWINSGPLTIDQLLGQNKVVLVDFWTYTCVNCLRTLPFLREWHAKYKDSGLVILGVHTPEFDFEKVASNVEKAAADHGVAWPIAQDNDYGTWNAFGNRYWPAKYLITPDGELIYTHFGEGAYAETEEELRDALTAAGYDVSAIAAGTVDEQERDETATTVTRELYGGYERNYGFSGLYAGQDQYYEGADKVVTYVDTGKRESNKFYLHGPWRNAREAIVHASPDPELKDYLALKFSATSVNVVIESGAPEEFDVFVEIEGRPLAPDEAGADVRFDDQGRSYFTVDSGRLYSIVQLPEYATMELKLRSASDKFAVFAFTFGVYESGI
jgi:thiol-disulfide isomerase/thioredoxin